MNTEKSSSTNSFLISPNDHQTTVVNKKYQNIIKKYRKKVLNPIPASSSSLPIHETSSTTNSNQNLLTISKQISTSKNTNKDVK
jgi:hypothetical protein